MSERKVINGHVLHMSSDFEGDEQFKPLGIAVIDGGLNVCMNCGEYESGLKEPCTQTATAPLPARPRNRKY